MRPWLPLLIALIAGAEAIAQDNQPTKELVIPLDTTGVSDWTFLNPASVPPVDGVSVSFRNTTSDRTFMVETDFVYDQAEFESAYAGARIHRRNRSLRDVVCGTIDPSYDGKTCTGIDSQVDPKHIAADLDRIEELRVLIEAVAGVDDGAEPPSADDCAKTPHSPPCLVERLYWTAACAICGAQSREPWSGQLSDDATRLIGFLIQDANGRDVVDLATIPCPLFSAMRSGKLIHADDDGRPNCKADDPQTPSNEILPETIRKIGEESARNEFARSRTRVARAALLAAAKDKLDQTFKMDSIAAVRTALQKRYDDRSADTNRKAEVEVAAKLLSSYSSESSIPFQLPHFATYPQANARNARQVDVSRVADYGVLIEGCGPKDGKVKCAAVATIPPHQRVTFSNATLRHNPSDIVRFKVSFFGLTAPPPNSTAYVKLGKGPGSIPSEFGISLGIDGATAYDLASGLTGHNRHTSGAGTTAIEFSGGIVDGSVSLRFKNGDFGGPASTETVTVSEYQAKVFGSVGASGHPLLLQYGQFGFAAPSSGIAIDEEGEGLLLAFEKLAASYIIHRESDAADSKANFQNDDYYVTMLQMKNIPFRWIPSVDGIDFIAAYGNNKNDDRPSEDPVKPRKAAYTFTTVGSEARFSFTRLRSLPTVGTSVALYHSERHVRPRRPDSEELTKGRGTVGLATFGWQWSGSKTLFEQDPKSRPSFGPTFTIARGTGDNPATAGRDEGYLGETAGFANDQIFLSQVAEDETLGEKLGKGLVNKWYAGVQWSDARGSLLGWLSRHIGNAENIESSTTNVALHTYRFTRDVQGHHAGGVEGDIEFLVEIPANVTWSVAAAYYHRSEAVKLAGLARDLWQVTAGVTLKLQGP